MNLLATDQTKEIEFQTHEGGGQISEPGLRCAQIENEFPPDIFYDKRKSLQAYCYIAMYPASRQIFKVVLGNSCTTRAQS